MFHGYLDYFQKPPLGGRPNIKLEDHGTLNTHDRWFILLYHVWGTQWMEIHWNSIWLRYQSRTTSHLHSRMHDHTTWCWRCVGTAFEYFLLGSHNFKVMALGSCVKWPWGPTPFESPPVCYNFKTYVKRLGS